MPRGVPDTWRLGTGEERARVAVVGCGGAGCNTLRHVLALPNAERVVLNDALHPSMAGIPRRLLVKPDSLRAYASMDEKTVPQMETNEEKDMVAVLLDRDLVFAVGGLGGELGGWAMSLVGRVARILGDTTFAFATIPFAAEGMVRREAAEAQLALLRRRADAVVTFENDHLLHFAPDLPLARSFAVLSAVMVKPIAGLSAVASRSDVLPLRRMFGRPREWRFGMGAGAEKHRCFLAVEEAYHSPWFTGRHEDIRVAVVLMALPEFRGVEEEILHEIRIRSPLADIAWAVLPETTVEERVAVQILAGH